MGLFSGGGSDLLAGMAQNQQNLQGQAWNQTNSYLTQLRGALQGYLTGKVGFDPQQLALLKSQLLNSVAKNYSGASANVKTALARTGSAGNGPVGGDYVRGIASLEGANADAATGGLANVDLANLQQALQNKMQAAGILSGNANTLTNWGSNFTNGMDSAMKAYASTYQPSMMSQLGSSMMQKLGSGLGSMGIGGLSNVLNGNNYGSTSMPELSGPGTLYGGK